MDQNQQPAPAEIHTSVENAHKAEELARAERILEQKRIEQHAHEEAQLVKQELENKGEKTKKQ
ncbi:7974_t:CDS:2 [Ambispora leptoticha]|uniref:7974_t:CDS:1 n=1 Tax=Ambispora leptoticha TaxID=144679 RepID=A0A9N9DS15_9GLOM|nr:7974_t:CDS:2 [Ambispora leptoticha]